MSVKIPLVCLKPGHNYKNVNQSPDGTYFEWEHNQAVMDLALEMFKYIPGIDAFITKRADTYPTTLQGEVQKAIDAGADIYVSKHTNANGTGKWTDVNGCSVYVYPGREDSLALARIAVEFDKQLLPMKNLGIKTADLFEIRVPPMPAILYETGYHTNKGDTALLKTIDFRILEAKAVTMTCCKYFGVRYREKENDIMGAQYHVVRAWDPYRDGMANIAKLYGLTLEKLSSFNPHVDTVKYVVHEGDIVYIEQPGSIEIKLAELNREAILCRKEKEDINKLKEELLNKGYEVATLRTEINNVRKAISSFAMTHGTT